jgi:hypothetical protein
LACCFAHAPPRQSNKPTRQSPRALCKIILRHLPPLSKWHDMCQLDN